MTGGDRDGQSSWLVARVVPGIERQPLKDLTADPNGQPQLPHRCRDEAVQDGRPIKRIAVAYKAGRDGFWLARWLRARRATQACLSRLAARKTEALQ
jgi:transposase